MFYCCNFSVNTSRQTTNNNYVHFKYYCSEWKNRQKQRNTEKTSFLLHQINHRQEQTQRQLYAVAFPSRVVVAWSTARGSHQTSVLQLTLQLAGCARRRRYALFLRLSRVSHPTPPGSTIHPSIQSFKLYLNSHPHSKFWICPLDGESIVYCVWRNFKFRPWWCSFFLQIRNKLPRVFVCVLLCACACVIVIRLRLVSDVGLVPFFTSPLWFLWIGLCVCMCFRVLIWNGKV